MKFFFPLTVLAFFILLGGSFADEVPVKGKGYPSNAAISSAIYEAMKPKPNYGGPYGSFQLGYNGAYNQPSAYGAYGAYGAGLGSLYGGSLYSKPNNNVIDLNNLMVPAYAGLQGAGAPYGGGQYGALSAYNRPPSYSGSSYAAAAANAYNSNNYANLLGSYGNAASTYAALPSYVPGGYRGALKVNRMSDDVNN